MAVKNGSKNISAWLSVRNVFDKSSAAQLKHPTTHPPLACRCIILNAPGAALFFQTRDAYRAGSAEAPKSAKQPEPFVETGRSNDH